MTRGPRNAGFVLLALALAGGALAQGTHENAPGTRAHDAGNRAYAAGDHREALLQFHHSARWADKLSQYNIGTMHWLGEGTARDPAAAWAWFELAAERGYPRLVKTADAVWETLDDAQRGRARRIHAELLPVYGDAVAVERTAQYMDRKKREATGSRTGFIGAMRVRRRHAPDGFDEDGEEFYADERWDYRTIVDLETRLFDHLARGRVTIGEFEVEPEQVREEP